MLANMGSAATLMLAGDVMAQELEHSSVVDTFAGRKEDETEAAKTAIPEEKRLIGLKRYGTLNPSSAQTAAVRAYDETKHKHHHQHGHHLQNKPKGEQQRGTTREENTVNASSNKNDDDDDDDEFESLQEFIMYGIDTVQAELEFWDGKRTATMIVWSAGAYTPLYVALYKVCDRYMPHQTPATIFARVLLSFVLSVPINTAFFSYGVCVHHSLEWLTMQKECTAMLEEMGISTDMVDRYGSVVPYDSDLMWKTARLKLESELLTTVVDSAKVWIPINIMNFTITPPYLQPMVLLTFSVFWNTYLSLAQHRDLSLTNSGEE